MAIRDTKILLKKGILYIILLKKVKKNIKKNDLV